MKKVCILLFFIQLFTVAPAQILSDDPNGIYNPDSVRAELDKRPYFTLFKDNYFAGGTTLGHKPTGTNSDVKFQISISQRLTKSQLPFDTYLFIQYTQKAFWNVFQNSLPMRDINFNPGIGLGHLIVYKNKYVGRGYLMVEHESNGRDSTESRSWNRVTAVVALVLNKNWEAQFKIWAPIIDGENNKDILKYNGIFQLAGNYRTNNRHFNTALILTKRKSWFGFNAQFEVSYKFNDRENQYLFLQYYNGYGENLLDYNVHKSMIRLGFVIKPRDFSFY
ncbi:MAG: phospholipase A [Tannerellaceae bacterium]|nr:phospholipase A [Tannerellaceae bacterium]MCD8264050.1 phospholipase A [Tannerellaceae bacterium]